MKLKYGTDPIGEEEDTYLVVWPAWLLCLIILYGVVSVVCLPVYTSTQFNFDLFIID